MGGTDTKQSSMLCLMSPESLVPAQHPIRAMKKLADAALRDLSPVFDAMYAGTGRPSIPPERLLKASLSMALYTVRSERQLCEQLTTTCCFVGSSTWTWSSRASITARSPATASGFSGTTFL